MAIDVEEFERAQGLLRGLLIALHGRLPTESLNQLSELVDAGELPLALEVLLLALEQAEIVPSSMERNELTSLAERMSVRSSYLASLP